MQINAETIGAPVSALATLTSANLNSTTRQAIYTVPTGKKLIIDKIITKNASTSLTTAIFGFGFNELANDVVATALHTTLVDNTVMTTDEPIAGAKIGNAGDILYIKSSLAQGAVATADIILIGFLI